MLCSEEFSPGENLRLHYKPNAIAVTPFLPENLVLLNREDSVGEAFP